MKPSFVLITRPDHTATAINAQSLRCVQFTNQEAKITHQTGSLTMKCSDYAKGRIRDELVSRYKLVEVSARLGVRTRMPSQRRNNRQVNSVLSLEVDGTTLLVFPRGLRSIHQEENTLFFSLFDSTVTMPLTDRNNTVFRRIVEELDGLFRPGAALI